MHSKNTPQKEKEKEKKESSQTKIIKTIANKIHEWWRALRLFENTQDTFKVRWKNPEDLEFEDYWNKSLWEWEQLNVSKWNDWKIYIDIANTHTNQLPDYWKNSNQEVCEYSINIMIKKLSSFNDIDNELLDEISVKIHDFWRSKNPALKEHFLFWETWERLLEIKKWNIGSDYIEYIRNNKDAHRMWEELSYETKPWFGNNLFEATDEQVRIFLIEQVTFDLKKDLDKFLETLDIARKITNNDFSKLQEYKGNIIKSATISIHEVWRQDRLLDEEWTYHARWKSPNSKEFEDYWSKRLNKWECLSVKKDENSKIQIDIANTSFWMLTSFWKDACLRSSNFSVDFITKAIDEWKEINSELILEWALLLNDNWLENNPWAKTHFIMWKSWKEILEIAKWNIDKDSIDKLRFDESTKETYSDFCKSHENFPKNIKEANYRELVFFLIHEAKFIIRKNIVIMLYAFEEISEEKFPKYQIWNMLKFLNWDSIVWYLSNQDSIVNFKDIIENKVPQNMFYSDVWFEVKKASSFKLKNWKSLNEIWALCCSYSKLEWYSKRKLKELWINDEEDIKIFEEYKEYVRELELKIKSFIDENSKKDREILDWLIEELSKISWSISKIWTILNYGNLIWNWAHKKIPIKWTSRIMEKVLSPWFFDWDFSKISDVVRWTLEFDSVIDLYNWLEDFLNLDFFKRTNAKVLIKDNIWNPLWDAPHSQKYRDINCIIKLENWHTVELQFQLKPMLQANNKWIKLKDWTIESLNFSEKDREDIVKIASKIKKPKIRLPKNDFVVWHEIYEIWRSIWPKDYASQELKEKLNQLLIYIHQEAFEKSMYSRKTETKLQINSYQVEIRANLKRLLNTDDMEKDFLSKCKEKFSDEEMEKVKNTISLIKKKHNWQYRDENTPYYTHCVHTALLLLDDWWDFEDVIVCLLHDILEDTNFSGEELKNIYWETISDYIDLLSKSKNWEFKYENDFDDIEYYNNLRKNKKALKYKAYDRLSNLISTYFSSISYKEKYIEKTKKYLLPIIEEEFPDIAKKYKIVLNFLENHSISEEETKQVEELRKIRELIESLK